ncbi:sensor histidine kinase KdpD [Carboxylicivirga sp. M1479]|uniref:sensor histidine kinase n=1 Tax=Carboxylicivirga sp. M1479 TaxID=2594476 RepID=UPI0011779943|nr:HAMP domain-containing sensor histidine kinase [Carboxylicivirga sp. M1479]TRX66226.1 HAMP domain-containing histidine kinase [Carboxylicivirga sp. M1479]
MGKTKQYYGLSIATFIGLALLLFIQISYMVRAARLEEKNFNHRVVMALKDSRDEIGKRLCPEMDRFLCGNNCINAQKKSAEVDSIIHSQLEIYNLPLTYTFAITDTIIGKNSLLAWGPKCYQQTLNGLLEREGIRLRLQFPNRNRFILAEMSGLFIVSIIVILFLLASYSILLRLIKREQTLMTHMREFVNNMLHEFQTPLANIRLAANLILKKNSEESKTGNYAQVVLNEYERMQNHVEDILKLSCDASTDSEFNELDMKEVIDQLVQSFKYRVDEKGGTIKAKYGASNHVLFSYNGRLSLVMSNLLDNAIKYSLGEPHIIIETLLVKNMLQIKVKDNGIGIAKKELPYIFDKYYRVGTGDLHEVKGFGLGLTFVKKVIEEHKGSITVDSEKGKGTCFTLLIPLK